MKKLTFFWRKGVWALLSLFFLSMVGLSLLYVYLESQLPNVDLLKTVQLQVPLQIFTADGLLIQEYGEKRRIPVSYDKIPPLLIQALLATEDQRFFDHPGVDVYGLARATVRMIETGTKSQGGSTITMQVARNFFLNRKKTFLRKFNEILLAIKIDRELSKEKILELYLNKIYLGNRAYGIGAAAQVYYGKTLAELDLAELAMIAGLPQAPSTQNPIVNPKAAQNRRDHVLERLLEEKYITQAQYQQAILEPVEVHYHGANIDVKAPYVAEMIRQSLYTHFGPDAYTKGYKVYTTIDGKLQNAADQLVEENLIEYEKRHGYRGSVTNIGNPAILSPDLIRKTLLSYPSVSDLIPAVVTKVGNKDAEVVMRDQHTITLSWNGMSWVRPALRNGWVGNKPKSASQIVKIGDVIYIHKVKDEWQLTQVPQVEAAFVALNPQNGAIKVLIGGFNFEHSKFNRVTQSARQAGSSFKPFIYAAALNKGYSLSTLVNDSPILVDDPSQPDLWRPHNDNDKFLGPIRLKEGLVRSRNMVSIRILDDIGINYAIDYATHFGFKREALPHALSLALGSASLSPMDIATAYAVFANGGYKIDPYLIDHVTDNRDKILFQAKPIQVCDPCQDASMPSNQIAPRVIPTDVAFLMHTALMGVVQQGTAAQAAASLNRKDIAGKTGTTNKQFDGWFAGYNPNLVATAWVGYDAPRSLHEYGAAVALPLWIDFMKVALKGLPELPRKAPENVVAVKINPDSGMLAQKEEPNAIIEYFREEEIPSLDESTPTVTDSAPAGQTPGQENPDDQQGYLF